MRRRTHIGQVVQVSLLGGFFLCISMYILEVKSIAQGPPPASEYKVREVKLTVKEAGEKAKEKNKAKNLKERADLAAIEEYYRDYLIPQLTQPSPENINLARREFIDDFEAIEKNKELAAKFNPYFAREMVELATKGADGKAYSPWTRIEAAVLLGKLNSEPSKPYVAIQAILPKLIDQKENDGLISTALVTMLRHLRTSGAVSEAGRNRFVQSLQAILTTPAPITRDHDAHDYILEQVIECLTEIAKTETDKEASKLALATLSPALVKIIDEQKSEWLVEVALHSLGSIKLATMTPEDAVTLEKAIAKFIKQSLKDWKKRIGKSSGAMAGGSMGGGPGSGSGSGSSEFGGGGPGRGGRGSGSGGSSSGSSSGSSGEGSGSGGSSGFGGGGATGGNKQKRPFEDQPKEVKNARRIAHQRFERIHLALNGNPLDFDVQKKTGKTTKDQGLLVFLPEGEKAKVSSLLSSVDAFQKALNDEKVSDLSTLSVAVAKSIIKLRADCDLILGEIKEVVVTEEENLVPGGEGR